MTETEIFQQADQIIAAAMKSELKVQGHHLTGALEESIKGEITSDGNGVTLTGYSAFYGQIINHGTTAARIPFNGITKSGGHSKYIEGLRQYWILRGLDEKEALRAAFATAIVQKRDGMSTSGSSRFSSTGRRQDFIGSVSEKVDKELDEAVLNGYDELINEAFQQTQSEEIEVWL